MGIKNKLKKVMLSKLRWQISDLYIGDLSMRGKRGNSNEMYIIR